MMSFIKEVIVTTAMRLFLTLLAIFVLTKPVLAETEVEVLFGGWSTHITDQDYDFNETHNMLGLEVFHNGYSAMAARFDNSYDRESIALAVGKHWHPITDIRLSLYGGAVHGYTSCFGDEGDEPVVCPLVVPAATYTKYKLQPTIMLMNVAVVLSFSFNF